MTRALLLSITPEHWPCGTQQRNSWCQGRGLRRSATELCAVAWAVRPKPSTHDRAVAGFRLEALSACPAPSKLSVARSRKRRVDPNMERPITIVLAATLVGWLGSTGSGLARIGHRRAAFIFALRTYD